MLVALLFSCSADGSTETSSSEHTGDEPREATLADLLGNLATNCSPVEGSGKLSTDDGGERNIPVCQLEGAVSWMADMDVDCDGLETEVCNRQTDDAYQDDTSIRASDGSKIDASVVPFVVVPLATGMDGCEIDNGFDYRAADVQLGAVAAVVYQQQIHYGAFVDEGPCNIIGEASYAMASRFGFDPDPSTGGHEKHDVAYFVFTGADAVAPKVEDESAVGTLGYDLVAARMGIPN